jgi:hypothetical protein
MMERETLLLVTIGPPLGTLAAGYVPARRRAASIRSG